MVDAPTLSVAPMMEWTDRHCRRLHRCFAPGAQLYTEMVTTGALLHGPRDRLLAHSAEEAPVILQLGGCDPSDLARCTELAAQAGYTGVNLNVGCPSNRVQHARIGACLMREPELVRDCVLAMREASSLPVSVKCRLGVDGADTDEFLHTFVRCVADAGVTEFILHARIAILRGLSPAQNRSVPPINMPRVARMVAEYPELHFVVNGGIDSVAEAENALEETGAAGVMIGRAAYHNPWLLAELAHTYQHTPLPPGRLAPLDDYLPYVEQQLADGVRLHSITRHLLGVANGLPGARAFRRVLSERANAPGADIGVLHDALAPLRARLAA